MKKPLIFAVTVLVLIGGYLIFNEVRTADKSAWSELGVIRVKGGGLPGYDIDGDGRSDYIQSGFYQFVERYKEGGFDYPGGEIQLTSVDRNITMPSLHFSPYDLAESPAGSVVIFSAEEENLGIGVDVIYKTIGRTLISYTLIMKTPDGSFFIMDDLEAENVGTFEEREVEVLRSSIH
ncbi:MAG: hypothetical protein V3T58_07025 [Candidatus Hydrothermarchaeales archaeon]